MLSAQIAPKKRAQKRALKRSKTEEGPPFGGLFADMGSCRSRSTFERCRTGVVYSSLNQGR
eukprot:9159341-Pyramimonas_sp.AAC.1